MLAPSPLPASPLPAGWVALPLAPGGQRIGGLDARVLVRKAGGAWQFVPVRSNLDAEVVLGALCDSAGTAQALLEVWIQRPAAGRPGEEMAPPTNAAIDDLWESRLQQWRAASPGLHIATGLESCRTPLVLDPSRSAAVPLAPGGAVLTVCTDDSVLEGAGLPTYSGSWRRYLWDGGRESPRLYPCAPAAPDAADAPETPHGPPFPAAGDGLVFNPHGGLLAFTLRLSCRLTDVLDALTAQDAARLDPLPQGAAPPHQAGEPGAPGGPLYFTLHDASPRLAETLYLKLSLLLQCAQSVRAFLAAGGRPHLDLAPDRFRVALAPSGGSIPQYWTARACLCAPGAAASLHLGGPSPALWVRAADEEVSPYRPQRRSASALVRADVRIESVGRRGEDRPEDTGRVVIAGALATESELALRREDVLAFSLPLPEGALVVHAALDPSGAEPGRRRFRSFPVAAPPSLLREGRDLSGVVFRDTEIRLIPTFAAPFDLYALAVIAVRALLVNSSAPIGPALESVLTLARRAAASHATDEPLEATIAALCEADPDLGAALGRERLIEADLAPSPGEAELAIPQPLWCGVLATVVRMFPALGPFSICASLGDAPRHRPERIFDVPVADLRRLSEQARSLVVARQQENHELRSVIESMLDPLLESHGHGGTRTR
jgi:hypothetical protein